jgi:hypothetical protein
MISSGMTMTLLSRGALRSFVPLCQHVQSFSTSGILDVAGALDVLGQNVKEVKREGNMPSEVYQQLVRAGSLSADPHQLKVVAQVQIQ